MTTPARNGISRRQALQGLGTVVALPWLESLAVAASPSTPAGVGSAVAATGAPKRVAFLYVPNGVHVPDWTPKDVGKLAGELPKTLAPLQAHASHLNVFTGLTLDKARANGDGGWRPRPGHGERSSPASRPRKTHGADIRVGQVCRSAHRGRRYRRQDPFRRRMELGIERGAAGWQLRLRLQLCVLIQHVAGAAKTTPNAKETDPKARVRATVRHGPTRRTAPSRQAPSATHTTRACWTT